MSLENNSGPVREDYRPTDPVDAAHYTAARKFSAKNDSVANEPKEVAPQEPRAEAPKTF